ncbi:MAG: class I SAM-dependent methyltransferase [Candidatus Bathyarchaeia archaeon]
MSLYEIRFSKEELAQKQMVWEALCERFLQKFVKRDGRVLDLAAGHCEFINNIECAEKYAIDLDPQYLKSAKADVHAIRQSCTNLSNFRENFFDLVFASNIFEHLESKEEHEKALKEVWRFLPYTTKSGFPKSPALVRLYLMFPPAWRIFGKQMLVCARR